ncbi:uncharacterized protein LOC124283715 [Haliotis rubra]|uniref:uncharacterized protein LOC124283715 n=1 Tax=Haliotis rubra TaxID=36100 RepID=UPI001EE5DE13|nr:uncharacterized protein LOC124283715 [Haliotis rubra]
MAESAENVKIECRSKRTVSSIVTAINEHIENIVSGNPDASEEDKERCRLRFREIYETAIQQNILIDGEECSLADTHNETSEFEPVDVDKRNYINNELVPNFDSAIVRVARKRKFHPRFCEEETYEIVNKQAFYLAKVEVTNEGRQPFTLKEDPTLLAEPKLKAELKNASSQLDAVTKTVTSSVEKAEKLHTAVGILQQPSKTDKIIYDSGCNIASSSLNSPLNTRLNGTAASSAVLSEAPSSRQHQDYVVEV